MKYKKLRIALCLGLSWIATAEGMAKESLNPTIGQHKNIFPERSTFVGPDSIGTDSTTLVQVAFRKVQKKDLMGNVQSINVPQLLDKSYNTYSLENLDAFIPGYNGNIWGMGGYLVLVDGFPRDANNVMPTEIDQVSVLKGANAIALYGSRAAKGVISITTKRGKSGGQQIKIRANSGINAAMSYPQYLGSAEYMTLYNEARQNDGLSPLYSAETIYQHAAGTNPYRYPNVDYYSSDYIKDHYNRYDATAEISGGNQRAQYYTNFGFWSEGSLLNFGQAKKNGGANRFNMRGNIDVKVNDLISLNVDAAASFYISKGVNADYWGAAATVRPHRFSPLIPIDMIEEGDVNSMVYVNNSNFLIDGKYLLGGSQLDQTNAFANVYAGGTNRYLNRQFQFNTGLNFDLKNILEGLVFKTNLAVDYQSNYNQSYNNNYAVYQASWNNYDGKDLISSLTKYGDDRISGIQNISGSTYRQTIGLNGSLNFNRTYGNDHHVSAILLANAFQIAASGSYHKTSNANLGLQLGYNYSSKYYVDFSSAYSHSAKLPQGNRRALSPTLALAWRLSKENFLVDSKVVNELRLSASAGILNTDLDISDYYLYQGYYTYNDAAWYSWRDGDLVHTFDRRRGDNPNMKFPKRKEFNINLEGGLYNNLITFNTSYFVNRMSGGLVQAATQYPMYFMTYWPVYSDLPYVNFNDDERRGVDFGINLNKQINKTFVSLGFNGMYYTTKAVKRDELYEFAYQNRAGKPLDAIWGLQHDGFYNSQSEIDQAAFSTFGEVKPGDIKYKDQNGDGTIDTRDEVYLGKGGWAGAPLTLGCNLTVKWNNFTLFAAATGQFGAKAMKNSSYFWVDAEDKYSVVVRDRWTESTKETATYPRLTTFNSDNNFRSSDFWLYKTDRINLSKVQLSYDFPKRLFNAKFIHELGIYATGSNLLTIAKEKETMQLNIGQAPQMRFFNIGLKALF
ncbi:SusC/RagA family TonB-linked outer membrane protein [Sphingobacterium siyangense]|uniref:SusC/RagA family TonB-linked outer membrane protein n=1 Tax=Sphingobacterium siyangense TaxID=459529 RepID=UPI00196252AE|nr:SusC/RagA family TonB-linked outer membrane protein [Sphingobacterium siyangense]QRY59858.1 SusC/RagA family TonB-linked outer membrane protein [Sphingobacterium siyangense]